MCVEHNLGTLIPSELRSGLLTGKYTPESHFADVVRERWNERDRTEFEQAVARAGTLRVLVTGGQTLVQLALAALLGRPGVTTLIPGAKPPEQVRANAAAADQELSEAELEVAFAI